MGAGKSKPSIFSKGPTRESLLKSTEPMRLLMNAAFKLMMEQVTTKDLLSMGSTSECSKYVIIMGQSFDKYFKSIDIVPVIKGEKEKRTIYFQKADILTGTRVGTTEEARAYAEQRKQVCLILGYFFTKLFQIFAAIYFSVADDDSIRPGHFVQDVYGVLPGQMYGKQQGGPVLNPKEGVYFGGDGGNEDGGNEDDTNTNVNYIGGSIKDSIQLGRYEFLRQYLNEIPGTSNKFKVALDKKHIIYFILQGQGYSRLLLIDRLGDREGDYEGEKLLDILCTISISRDQNNITLNVEEARDYRNNIALSSSYLKGVALILTKYTTKDGKEQYMTKINNVPVGVPKSLYNLLAHIQRNIVKADEQKKPIPPLSFTKILQNEIIQEDIRQPYQKEYREYREPALPYRDPIKALLKQQQQQQQQQLQQQQQQQQQQLQYKDPYRDQLKDPYRGQLRDPYRGQLKDKYENPYTDPYERYLYDKLRREQRAKQKKRELEKIPETFRSGSVYSSLQPGMRPVPHCIARSLQLLNVDALGELGGKKAFSYICKTKFLGTHATGLPAHNKPIADSPGLNTLMALFREFGDKDKSDYLKKQRLDALNILAKLYNSSNSVSDGDFLKIINRYDPYICKTLNLNEEAVSLTPAKFAAAKNGVMRLWNIQLLHVKNIESLVREIFVINKTGALVLNPQLMTIGVEGLDLIAHKLRNILLVYYGNCEKTYQDTVTQLMAKGTM